MRKAIPKFELRDSLGEIVEIGGRSHIVWSSILRMVYINLCKYWCYYCECDINVTIRIISIASGITSWLGDPKFGPLWALGPNIPFILKFIPLKFIDYGRAPPVNFGESRLHWPSQNVQKSCTLEREFLYRKVLWHLHNSVPWPSSRLLQLSSYWWVGVRRQLLREIRRNTESTIFMVEEVFNLYR
jgi:hypothetical protein